MFVCMTLQLDKLTLLYVLAFHERCKIFECTLKKIVTILEQAALASAGIPSSSIQYNGYIGFIGYTDIFFREIRFYLIQSTR